jgi:hypothetical protein
MPSTILIYGNDRVLVNTRCLLLAGCGYQVVTALNFKDAKRTLQMGEANLLVWCSSISPRTRKSQISEIKLLFPALKQLVVTDATSTFDPPGSEKSVVGLSGPKPFLTAVRQMQPVESTSP